MGQAGSVTACGNTVHKEKHNLQSLHQNDIEPKQNHHPHHIKDKTHNTNNNDKQEYQHHNPLYNQYASISNYKHPKSTKRSHKLKTSKKHHPKILPTDDIHDIDIAIDIDLNSDDNIMDDHLNLTLQDYHHHHHHNTNNDVLTPSKRRIKYRERPETHTNNTSLTHKQYLKYKKYKKLRTKYLKMDQFIDNLLSLNPKNLQHILILRKTDNININNFYRYIMSDHPNHISLHLPQLKRVSESLSFYAMSFKPINNSRKLWHILLQDKCRKHITINESLIRGWTKQLLLAIHFLHTHNIVHLDISPESIIICNDENRLILSGFDASMLVNDHITYNLNSALLNSCWQLPPSTRRRNDFNGFEFKAFDMWSIGILVFLLLTAKFPFYKDKNSKRIAESCYVNNEQRISHNGRDFISKLLSSNITNRLTVSSALQHCWITNAQKKHDIKMDGSIYGSMYQHHQQKLKLKYAILAQETRQYLFVCDQKRLNKKIKKLNKKICKYQEYMEERKNININKHKRSSINLSKSHTKYLMYNDYDAESGDSTSLYLSSSDEISESEITDDISSSHDSMHSGMVDNHYYRQKNVVKKKRKHHSDSLRITAHKYDIKKRNRSNSTATYGEYRANNSVNKINVEKWQETKTLGDEEENVNKAMATNILSPLISSLTNTDEQKQNVINNVYISPSHNNKLQHVQQNQRHQMHHFVRTCSNSQHLTPSNTKKNTSNIPIYSRGTSGHNTNVTTPKPTSSSTQPYDDRFKFKIKHQHKNSYGNLIAIERSVGADTSPKQSPKLPVINQYISYDMLTNDPIIPITKTQAQAPPPQTRKNVRQIPRRPLLPPKIIKLDSPSQTVNGNLSSSSSEKEKEVHKKRNYVKVHVHKTNVQRRSFQITRRPLSPVKAVKPVNEVVSAHERECLDIDEEKNVALHVHKRPSMFLISNSTTNVGHDRRDTHSSEQIDFLSSVMSNKHPINEYDPLDLNDSTLKKTKWIPPQLVTQTTTSSPSSQPQQQQQQLHTFAYPILSVKNLSLHQQQLSTQNETNNSMREEINTHTKDLSGSGSGLILQNIVKNHTLLRAPENSDSNFTSNSKAVIRNTSSIENTKSKSNKHSLELSGPNPSPKPTRSAMDLLKMHAKGNNNAYVDYLSPHNDNPDIEESVRSSIMSLENILQARGLYKKDQIKTSRDIVLDDKKEKSEHHKHNGTNTDSITDSRSLLEHILEYAVPDNNLNINEMKVHHESKQEEINDFVPRSPKGDLDCSYDAHVDDIGMYTQLDPHLLLNNPAIQIRHAHNAKKIPHVHNRSSSGRASLFTFDATQASDSNCITPPSTTDYKPHSHIHHNIQQQLQQSESQNEIIHPASPQPQLQLQSHVHVVPITSPLTHAKHAHYSFSSSNLHKKRSLFNKSNQTNVVDNNDSSEEEQSIVSSLSPNFSPPIIVNNNNNNDNHSGQSINSFVINNKPKSVKSNSRKNNDNGLHTDASSAEPSPNTAENDKRGDGRTSTY